MTYTDAGVTLSKNGTVDFRLFDGTNAGSNVTGTVGNIDKLAPNSFTPTTSSTTNSITVTASTTDQAKTTDYGSSGIAGYRFSKDNGSTWTAYQTSGTYTFKELTQNQSYTIKVETKDNAGNTTQASVTKSTGTVPSNITVSYSTTDWTKGNVTVTAKANVSGYTLQYKNGTTWTTYPTAGITFSKNGTVDFRLFDGTNGGSNVTGTVGNIDKLAPNSFTPTVTSTTNSITVTASATDQAKTADYGSSGIAGYRFFIMDLNEDPLDYGNPATSSWTDWQTSGTYTFTNLPQKQDCIVQVETVDNATNVGSGSVKCSTSTVPSISTSDIKFTFSPSTITNQNVKVTVTSNKDTTGYKLQYKTSKTGKSGEQSSWVTYTSDGITLTRNQEVYIRLVDSTGQTSGTYATGTITIIDKLKPTFRPTNVIRTNTTISIYGYGIDSSDSDNTSSGIAGYRFSKDGGTTWTAYQSTSLPYEFTGLTKGTTYNIKVQVKDNVGNVGDAMSVTTIKTANYDYIITLDQAGGTGGTEKMYVNNSTNKGIYKDMDCSTLFTYGKAGQVVVPTRSGYTFRGYIGDSTISADGTINSGFYTAAINGVINSDQTFTAMWYSFKISLNKNNGTGGYSYLYVVKLKGIYSDEGCTNLLGSGTDGQVTLPTRDGFTFNSYSSGTITSTGMILQGFYSTMVTGSINSDISLSAEWYTHKIILDKNGGTGGDTTLYVASKKAIYKDAGCTNMLAASKDGVVSVPTKTGYTFNGYGGSISAAGAINIGFYGYAVGTATSTLTLTATWK